LITLSVNSIALSQTIPIQGIDKEQKQEIVSTLLAYPILLEENKYLQELSATQTRLIALFESIKKNNESQLNNKDAQIEKYIEKENLYKKLSKPSSLFLTLSSNIDGFNSYGVGLNYTMKNFIRVGAIADYNNFSKTLGMNLLIGIKLK